MLIRRTLPAIFFISFIFVTGCATKRVTLKTFVEPSVRPESIRSVAIFPMRNVRLLPDESRELNRGVSQAFHQQSPNVRIVVPTESTALLNQAGLTEKYSDFLRDYAVSGIPNVTTLKEIGKALNVDAILQGEVFDIYQIDGEFGVTDGKTSVTVRYALLSTRDGTVLWEATSNAKKTRGDFTLQSAPPLYEVISLAQNKILTALPTLGK